MPTATQLRRDIAHLTRELDNDLGVLWRKADASQLVAAALHDVLPNLIGQYGVMAGSLAADWYDEVRDQRGARGRFRAIQADIADVGAHALIGWALSEASDYPAFQTLIAGGAQRRVANFSRRTVMQSSIQDRAARGWRRVGAGQCDFCQMLLGRGAVYTEATADFLSHDHCNCQAEPAF